VVVVVLRPCLWLPLQSRLRACSGSGAVVGSVSGERTGCSDFGELFRRSSVPGSRRRRRPEGFGARHGVADVECGSR
jgi:hypothetical protein